MSAHKIYAPKGVGALYVGRGVRLHAQQLGGHQERERRGGTESVPLIAAFGMACEIARSNFEHETETMRALRDSFEHSVGKAVDAIVFNGDREHRVPTVSNISFAGIEGEAC